MLKRFLRDRGGALSVYTAMFSIIAIGGGALAIDYGRMALLRSQMQDAADAAALAAAIHLDGKDNARSRAQSIAEDAADNRTSLASEGDDTPLAVAGVTFYSAYTPSPVAATDDLDAKIVEVTLAARTSRHLFRPVLNLVSPGAPTETELTARAVAGTRPYLCHAPPLMMCDLTEEDPLLDPTAPANIGRQVRLKEVEGGGTWAPGNFGLLALPDGSSGAADIETALAAEQPQDCYRLDVLTATGSKTNKVKDGINARFDIGPRPEPPAPNVINFPRDTDLDTDPALHIGDGNWDLDGYRMDKHGLAPPAELAGATRYQAYLYELGEPFGRNGSQTRYPVPSGGLPAGFTLITPPGPDLVVDAANPTLPDYDGVPQDPPAAIGPVRRVMQVALLQCIADGINGHGTYPTHGRFVEMFITEEVRDPPEAAIYGEIVRAISPLTEPTFHANAGLLQ